MVAEGLMRDSESLRRAIFDLQAPKGAKFLERQSTRGKTQSLMAASKRLMARAKQLPDLTGRAIAQ
jgi:hypothetical protein